MPQGIDAWLVDYQQLAISEKSTTNTPSQPEAIPFDNIEEAKEFFDKFEKEEHKLKLRPANDSSDLFPFTAELARLRFRIERGDKHYQVVPISNDSLATQIVEEITKTNSLKNLENLLVSSLYLLNLSG